MGKHDEQIRRLAEPLLVPGEEIVVMVLVNYNGTAPGTTLPGGAARSSDPDAQVAFPSARQMALALTGGRILVFNLAFSGKPKQHIGDVPLSAVDEVSKVDAGLSGVLRLTLRSGSRVDLEFLRGEPGEAFTQQLESLVEPAPAPAQSQPDLPSWDAPLGEDGSDEPAAAGDGDLPLFLPPVPPPPGGWEGPPAGVGETSPT